MVNYQLLPPLSPDEYDSLKADISERGVLVPIEVDEEGNILDGHHRVQICLELGIESWPRLVRTGLSEEEKRQHARKLNLARRHLNQEQRRDLIDAQLTETSELSDRQIAEISAGNSDLSTAQRYPVIYADPPWRYENPPMGDTNRSIENQYPTMALDEICALDVKVLATDDAILYMWATAPKLAECLEVVRAWDFEYRTCFAWIKDKIGLQAREYTRTARFCPRFVGCSRAPHRAQQKAGRVL